MKRSIAVLVQAMFLTGANSERITGASDHKLCGLDLWVSVGD
jgi:hypothetical protein